MHGDKNDTSSADIFHVNMARWKVGRRRNGHSSKGLRLFFFLTDLSADYCCYSNESVKAFRLHW